MRLYTVHTPPDAAQHPYLGDDGPLLIKEGFCWPAFFLSALWAAYHRLWLVMTGLVALEVAVSAAVALSGLDEGSSVAVSIAVAAVIGFAANDMRRWTLARRGWDAHGVVQGADADGALYRFLESMTQVQAPPPRAAPAPPLADAGR